MDLKPVSKLYLIALTSVMAMDLPPVSAAAASPEFFETKIRPVLAEHCYECHSATSKKLKGGLRVDGRAELLQGGETGPAIVPGKPESSRLFTAMAHRDPDLAMPPKKPALPANVLADFERWIAEGAAWPADETSARTGKAGVFDLEARKRQRPWLWATPQRQTIPAVQNPTWPRSSTDYFILSRLEAAGLSPAPAADDRTWLRRVYFAITGLPPTRTEIQEFLEDPTPEARARVVDRLLASPHYGERWARHWMDLMRYAESRGHEGDYRIANAWQYRDYLIRAWNADVPYGQFLLEHLAGDLLPQPRWQPGTDLNESVLGTGWVFLGEENHSPVDIRQDECDRLDNKVDVFTKSFLGLTVACARCHDHKFDPIRAQDYYAFSGFLLSSSYRQVRFETMENNRQRALELAALRAQFAPRLTAEIAESSRPGLGQMAAYLVAARETLGTNGTNGATPVTENVGTRSLDPARLQLWVNQLRQAATNQSHPLHVFARRALSAESAQPGDCTVTNLSSSPTHIIADYTRPAQQPWKVDGEAFGSGPSRPGDVVFGSDPTQPIARIMTYGAARRDPFWNRLTTAPGNENDSGQLAATSRSGQMLRTPTITLGDGHLHYLIKGKTRVYAAVDSHLMVEGPLHGRLIQKFDTGSATEPQWVTHDLSPYSGHRTHLEFGPDGDGEFEVLRVVESTESPRGRPGIDPFALEPRPDSASENPTELQRSATAACAALARGVFPVSDPAEATQHATWANWLVQNPQLFQAAPAPDRQNVAREYFAAEHDLAQRVKWASHTAVAWFDGTGVDENILLRGKPFKPGAVAPRSLPAAFALATPITNSASSGRYELGQQLVDPANPLVARVLVNRVWHHLFGRGLVATVDNFGALGEAPTHPELLDELAWQFVHEDQGSVKRLIRRLVLSQTFAMSSRITDARAEELDPANQLWHRLAPRRLEAEALRDALLVVSGRFNPAVGGPPVPVYLNEFVVGRGRPEQSGPLDGDGRRSIYTAVLRNFLPPSMLIFDSPTPFSTVGRRNVTNVPAQSLALMNDPLFHQQARVWAERLLRETPGADVATRIGWLFESAYGRPPETAELDACRDSLNEFRSYDSAAASELEVWGDLCHALLNTNDFLYVM